MEALLNGGLLSDEFEAAREGLADSETAEERLEQLIQQIIQKLQH